MEPRVFVSFRSDRASNEVESNVLLVYSTPHNVELFVVSVSKQGKPYHVLVTIVESLQPQTIGVNAVI